MKKIYIQSLFFFTILSNTLFGQAGNLDNSFGNGGKVITAVNAGSSEVWGMVVQDDWSIVVGGFVFNGIDSDFALIRYTPDGALDNTFGNNGIVTTAIGPGNDVIYSVALQQDGKIVAGGMSWNGTNYDFALARYNTNGSLDNTFGNNGIVTTAIGSGSGKVFSLKIQDDWSIVVGGVAYNGIDNDFALARYKTNGTLDSTFGVNGKVITPMGLANDIAFSIALQSDWSVVVGGVAYNGANYDFAVARYKTNGTLDSTFGTNGRVITDFSNSKDFVWSVAIQADGRIVVGGYTTNSLNNKDFALVRYNTNGSLDNTFGTGGKVVTPIGTGDEDIYSMVLQPDGKIVAGGGSDDSNAVENYALVRYNTNGGLDNNFGNGGQVLTPMSSGVNEIYAVALQPSGKIVAAGFAGDSTKANCSVARYLTDLSLGIINLSTDEALIYPNPVAQDATLQYILTQEENISISLMDMQGRIVKVFVENEEQGAGEYKQPIILPSGLPSGSYLICISSPEGKMTIKITK